MRTLFRLYLLGQLIAAPFMIGAIGHMLNGNHEVNSAEVPAGMSLEQYKLDLLCQSVDGAATSAIQDEIQQLKYITQAEDLYSDSPVTPDCPTPVPTPR